MSVFDDVREKLIASFSNWVKVVDTKNIWTIESFAKANYNKHLIKPHCVTCTIVNKCWFKNEDNKKPEEFDYSKYLEIPMEKRGLYHPNCHDKKISIHPPRTENIRIVDLGG